MNADVKNVAALFESGVITVCRPDRPFWVSGGRLSAFLVRCHHLLGDGARADSMLALLETAKDSPVLCNKAIALGCMDVYGAGGRYARMLDAMVDGIRNSPALEGYTHIAGTEGASLFFSLPVSLMLERPHLTFFQSQDVYLYEQERSRFCEKLGNAKILFVQDVFAQNNSYFKTWLPAAYKLEEDGKKNKLFGFALLDRQIGGSDRLVESGVYCQSLFDMDAELFRKAEEIGLITPEQFQFATGYIENPVQFMARFLSRNPKFLEDSLTGDPATAEKARLCVQRKLYQIVE